MANISQKDRILSGKDRKLQKGIGPTERAAPRLHKNKPGKTVGIGYIDGGLRAEMATSKHIFQT